MLANQQREKYFKASLDLIVSHFENPVWPRTIFTPKEKQVLVYSQDQALAKFGSDYIVKWFDTEVLNSKVSMKLEAKCPFIDYWIGITSNEI